MKKYLRLLLIPMLAFYIGCEDNEEAGSNVLITATFKNDWASSDYTNFLVIQNMDGEVLADTNFIGNTSFTLNSSDGETAPDRIIITTIKKYSTNLDVISNAGVKSGVNWTWEGEPEPSFPMFTSTFTFSNMSDFSTAVLSANGQYKRISSSPLSGGEFTESFDHHGENYNSEDILLMAYKTDHVQLTPGSGYYKIFQNVNPSDNSFVVDGDDLVPAQYKLIINNTNEPGDFIQLHAYGENESFVSENSHRITYAGYYPSDFDESGNFHAFYPPEYTSFRTSIASGYFAENGKKYWFQRTFGSISESLEKINADFELIDSSAANFKINATGVFDNAGFGFGGSDSYWTIYIDAEVLTDIQSLPSLSPNVLEEYPELSQVGFSHHLRYVRLSDVLCADDNDAWLDILFSEGYYGDVCNNGYRDVTYYVNY